MRARRAVACGFVCALLVAACDEPPTPHGPSPTPYRTPTSVAWKACGDSFECTTVSVPLDYSNPDHGSIGIAVINRHATDPSHRIGSLLINPGGPGASGVDTLRGFLAVELTELNRRFDLVSFDPRGVGRSSPVRCIDDGQRDINASTDQVLDDPHEKQVYLDNLHTFVQACEQNSGWLLPFVDTVSVARDMDVIRGALGEDKLSYLGFSYGTLLGEVYAHLFPNRVRALALDGVIDPTAQGPDWLVHRAQGLEANLQRFLAGCRRLADCTLASSGDPGARLAALMDRLDKTPLAVGKRKLTRAQAIPALLSYLVFPSAWEALGTALSSADEGDGYALLSIADGLVGRRADGTYLPGTEASAAVNCLDDRPIHADMAAYDQIGPALSTASPLFGPWLQYGLVVCTDWPVKPHPLPAIDTQGLPPILLIGATQDPYTPLVYAQNVSHRIAGSVVLARDGFGHTSFANSFCAEDAIDKYLGDLTLPATGTVCPSNVV